MRVRHLVPLVLAAVALGIGGLTAVPALAGTSGVTVVRSCAKPTNPKVFACMAEHRIDLLVNMHNTETGEYMDTEVSDPQVLSIMRHFDVLLYQKTTFDPSNHLTNFKLAPDDTNSLWGQQKVPVLLMEQRIATCPKLGRHPTIQDRLAFGRELITQMAQAVSETSH